MVKNVIIGANSYIARNFIYKLNYEYKDFDYKLYGKEKEHKDKCVNYSYIDVLDKKSIRNVDFDCKYIYMFVGKTGSAIGFDEYEEFIRVNQVSLLNLLNEYRFRKSSAKIIFISTRLVYSGLSGPQKEDAPNDFKTIYAINKFACEYYLKQFSNVFEIKYIVLRLCIPYGTFINDAKSYGTCEFMIDRCKKNKDIEIFGNGLQKRTLTYIGDVCDIIYNSAKNDLCLNSIYNIGGEEYTIYDLANAIARRYNVNVKSVPFPELEKKIESGDTVFDSEKLDSIIGNLHKSKFIDWINRS